MATTFKRAFSATAKALVKFVWEGTASHPEHENIVKDKLTKNRKLIGADEVKFARQPHTSHQDPKMRASGQVFRGTSRLTSIHVYEDGTVIYSKKSINSAQED